MSETNLATAAGYFRAPGVRGLSDRDACINASVREAERILAEAEQAHGRSSYWPADQASWPSLSWLAEYGPAMREDHPDAQVRFRDALASALAAILPELDRLALEATWDAQNAVAAFMADRNAATLAAMDARK